MNIDNPLFRCKLRAIAVREMAESPNVPREHYEDVDDVIVYNVEALRDKYSSDEYVRFMYFSKFDVDVEDVAKAIPERVSMHTYKVNGDDE